MHFVDKGMPQCRAGQSDAEGARRPKGAAPSVMGRRCCSLSGEKIATEAREAR